jgi:site-specific DNA recombinase
VSTDEQANEGVSLQAQEAKLRAWAALHEVEMTVEVDAGISGKSIQNRPALNRALEAIRTRRATVLVVCDLSRLSRTTRDALTIAEQIAKRGAELVSLPSRSHLARRGSSSSPCLPRSRSWSAATLRFVRAPR